jgi:hypothetical protein
MSQGEHTYHCWLCGHAVDLETSKTDEHGMAVHEECYALKLALANEWTRLMPRKPPHGIRRAVRTQKRPSVP